MTDKHLEDGREALASIKTYLVENIDLRAISRWQLPGKAQIIRESLLWRIEELAQNAFDTLDAGRFVASALATRAVMETTAGMVFLDSLMQLAIDKGVSKALVLKIDRFLINSKIWEELEDPIHINDMLREVEKVIPGFFEKYYATLSESAHPNWAGTFGAFGNFDKVNVLAIFRVGGRSPDTQRQKIAMNLAATLGLAKGYYEISGGKVDAFTKAAETYYAENPTAAVEPNDYPLAR
jgi:hypothetical protein